MAGSDTDYLSGRIETPFSLAESDQRPGAFEIVHADYTREIARDNPSQLEPKDGQRGPAGLAPPCEGCSARDATWPAIVEKVSGTEWKLAPDGNTVHLAALFRDPGISDDRHVPVVLDIRPDTRPLRAGRDCWLGPFLEALRELPEGIRVALDNGVRCRRPIRGDEQRTDYEARARRCHEETVLWFRRLVHPDGGRPGIAVCDKDLANSLGRAGHLTLADGSPFVPSGRFVDRVGTAVRYLEADAIILAHPALVLPDRVHRSRYLAAIKAAVEGLVILARHHGPYANVKDLGKARSEGGESIPGSSRLSNNWRRKWAEDAG